MAAKSGILAVGYIRCSTEMQEDSPEQQKKEILAYAENHGFVLNEWFVDFGKSGTTFDQRPEFQRLRASVENGHTFAAVICYDESRWGRAIDSEENTYWRFHFRRCGVDVVLVKTSIDPDHEFAPMLKSFESIQASQFSKKLSELTMRGAMNNGIYSSGGTAPYGYCRVARNIKTGVLRRLADGEWSVKKQEKVFWTLGDEGEVATVRHIFQERAKGASYVLIARRLNDKGVSCAKRGRWRNMDKKWSIGTLRSILENPVYCGTRTYNRSSSSKIMAAKRKLPSKLGAKYPIWRNPKEDWRIVENAHEGIVSRELWEEAFAAGRRSEPRGLHQKCRSRYLLSGLIHCSKCGRAYQGWSGTVRGKHYYRYIDGGWQAKRACPFLSIPQDKLEDFAIRAIKDLILDPEMIGRIESQLHELLHQASDQPISDKKAHERAMADNGKKMENLVRSVEEGALPGEVVRARLQELKQEQDRLQRLLSEPARSHPEVDIKEVKRQVAEFVLEFEKRFEAAPIEERKELVQRCISKIIVDRDAMVARFYVKRIPAVSPRLESLIEAKTAGSVMSNVSARNRT